MASANDIQNLYIAYFNRPADVAGLAYWTSGNQVNFTPVQIAQLFSKQVEYASIFSGLSTKQTVNALYRNLFGHDADPGGLTYWIGQMDNGTFTIGQVAIAILAGAIDTDAISVAAKLAAANSFTSKMAVNTSLQAAYSQTNGNAFDLTKTWLAGVTNTASGVAAAAKIDVIFSAMPDPTTSFNVKPGMANLGTTGNDTFWVGNETLLTSGTSIKGNGGADILNVSSYLNNVVHPTIVTGVSTLNLLGGESVLSVTDPFLNQFSIINDYKAFESIRLGNVAQTLNLYSPDSASVTLGAPNQVVRQLSKSSAYVGIGTTHANLAGAIFDLDHARVSTKVDRAMGPFGNKLYISDAGTATLSAAQLKNFSWVTLSGAENLTIGPATAIMLDLGNGDTTITETTGDGDVVIYMSGSHSLTLNTTATHSSEIKLLDFVSDTVVLSGNGNVVIDAVSVQKFTLAGGAGLVTVNLSTYGYGVDSISVTGSTLGDIATKLITIDNFKYAGGRHVLHTGASASSMGIINIAASDFNSLAVNIASGTGALTNNDHKAFLVNVAGGSAAGTYVYEHMAGTTVGAGDIIVKLTGSIGPVFAFDLQA
ncbi:DUF4214 domain-containing protein [Undibacterium sp. Di26W]|uniref:DUF4214 domain-containing protein n=1 Tax=Undibacterium sp. Di26W TaxID=3413035 RepID=UPI003BEF99EE